MTTVRLYTHTRSTRVRHAELTRNEYAPDEESALALARRLLLTCAWSAFATVLTDAETIYLDRQGREMTRTKRG